MKLRSGHSTLHNLNEFNKRNRGVQKKQLETDNETDNESDNDSMEDCDDEFLEKKNKYIQKKANHLIHLIQCQNEQGEPFSHKIKTVIELYEFIKNNMYYMVEYYSHHPNADKKLPKIIYKKAFEFNIQLDRTYRTRQETILIKRCRDLIMFVAKTIHRNILHNQIDI